MTILGSNPRARVNVDHPEAFAVCDRCGFIFNHPDLHWQYEWEGNALVNQRILVCVECLDTPQEQLRAILIPPDPVPVKDARPPWWQEQVQGNAAAVSSFQPIEPD